jgi:hypothetical protein
MFTVHQRCCADHRAFGLTALAMMVVQGILGGVRPRLGAQHRPLWRRVHQAWGWLTLLIGERCEHGQSLGSFLAGFWGDGWSRV